MSKLKPFKLSAIDGNGAEYTIEPGRKTVTLEMVDIFGDDTVVTFDVAEATDFVKRMKLAIDKARRRKP